MSLDTWLIFFIASLGLSVSPGPNGLLALTHGALYGPRKTLFTIAGGVVGFVALIGLCMFGIGALIKTSLVWLTVLKWVGGVYLMWLGVQVWRSAPIALSIDTPTAQAQGLMLFRQGWLSAVTNPKGLLFFSAFLPQFMDPQRSLGMQFVVVAATFAFTEFLTEYALAATAHQIRPWLARVGRRFNQACGGVFIAIGAALPLRS